MRPAYLREPAQLVPVEGDPPVLAEACRWDPVVDYRWGQVADYRWGREEACRWGRVADCRWVLAVDCLTTGSTPGRGHRA